VLTGVQMDAIEATGRRDACRVEVPAVQRSADVAVRLRKPNAFLCGAGELGGDGSFRLTIGEGTTTKTGGTGIPGSTGACRTALTSVATP